MRTRWQYFLLGFSIFAIPGTIWPGYQAERALANISEQRAVTNQQLADVEAQIAKIPPRSIAVAQDAHALSDSQATASFTAIQGGLDGYIDTLARDDKINVASSTCQLTVVPSSQPGLEGMKCSFASTGTWAGILDSTLRLTRYAPMIVYVTDVSLSRSRTTDADANPRLDAKTTLYIERVMPRVSPSPSASASPESSAPAEPTASPTGAST